MIQVIGWPRCVRRSTFGKTKSCAPSPLSSPSSSSSAAGTAKSSQVFDEMTRILAEEGVNQALAYASTKRPDILEKVKARTADARKKNRSDLLPLLKSAQLETDRNHPTETEHLFREILALEPDWSEARNAFAWFLIQRGEVIEPAQGNTKLREAVQICQGILTLNPRAESPQDWARTQNNPGNSLWDLGSQLEGEEGLKRQRASVEMFREVVAYQPNDQSRFMLAQYLGGFAFNLVLSPQFAGAQTRCEEAQSLVSEIGHGVQRQSLKESLEIPRSL